MKLSEEDILQAIEARSRQQNESVRQMLIAEGRADLLARFDATMKDINSGVYGARTTWNALTAAQQRALRYVSENKGRLCRYAPNSFLMPGKAPPLPIRLATVRNLIARELLACDGGAFDPEKVLVMTERGRFVLKVVALDAEAKKRGKR